jgi:hypothetical protein
MQGSKTMGLDITAASRASRADITDEQYDADPELWKTHRNIYPEPAFLARADGLSEGIYRIEGQRLDFRAGSYSGYNQWRDMLSRVMLDVPAETVWANPSAYQEAPFYPLINFSDAEGVIGPKTSAVLAHDFARFADKAATVPDDWWREKYALWRQAFELAADAGFVMFH